MRSGKYYQGVKVNGIKYDVHRIVAEEKIGRPLERGEVVHHINGDIRDNRPENLEVMTRPQHARLHKTGHSPSLETIEKIANSHRGKPNYASRKLNVKDVEKIYLMSESGMTYKQISWNFDVEKSTIRRILKGEVYRECIPRYEVL